MSIVNTVLGPKDSSELGFTLSHEHVLLSSAGIQDTFPEFIPREYAIEEGIRQLSEAKAEGVDTIIDLSTMDLGRDVRVIEAVAKGSEMTIVVATGTWLDVPRSFEMASPDEVAPLYIREIEVGIQGTGIKAGVIKVANEPDVSAAGEVILRAAARAHQATGVPIYTHTKAVNRVGDRQVEIFEDEGVNLNRVCVGHSNDSTDLGYLTGLMDKGVWLGLDRYPGRDVEWQERTEVLWKLIQRGYGTRLMLSHDWSVAATMMTKERMAERPSRNPDNYLFITRNVLPMLLDLGASQDQVDDLMVNNPRIFWEG
ncbi:MAG TPA: phosphotriesterase-related protein [Dehalococcoidia bacterium]|nr:phosphotriesterase-related protein [Dehalococcoidia bacterium]HIK90010.1 phosphotriesterase-related protein [Dehalococcoidia bacterium]